MRQFENVTLIKKANVYFDGKVTSRSFFLPDGERKTLGIMALGEYHFGTSNKERMEILAGKVEVKLPGEESYTVYAEGDTFEVPADSSYDIIVREVCDYCCSYIKNYE